MRRHLRLLLLMLFVLAQAVVAGPAGATVQAQDHAGARAHVGTCTDCDATTMTHAGPSTCQACQSGCSGGVVAIMPALHTVEVLVGQAYLGPGSELRPDARTLTPPARPPSAA